MRTRKSRRWEGAGEGCRVKFEALIKDTEQKANDVLNEEQKKNLKEVRKGPAFQFSPPPGGRKQ